MNLIQLAKNITDMVQNGDYVAGHSILNGRDTSKNNPNRILEEGFVIQDLSRGLPFTSRCFESNFEDSLLNLTDLCKNSSGAVIIISIPRELLSSYDPQYFDSYDCSSIILEPTGEDSEDYKNIDGIPTKIAILPSIYILGYLDVQKDIFIRNPQFAFDRSNKLVHLSELKPTLDKKYEKVLEKALSFH